MIKRLVSSFVGIALAIGVLFVSDTIIFNIAVSIISLTVTYELLKANRCLDFKFQTGVCLGFAVSMPIAAQNLSMELRYAFSLFCVFLLFCGMLRKHKKLSIEKLCYMIAVTILATLSLTCIVTLRGLSDVNGVCYVVLCLAGAWLGDAGAFFVGKRFGKHKLAPEISPKKTVEGAVGGVITVGIVFVIYSFCYHLFMSNVLHTEVDPNYLLIAGIGLVCGALGIVGDLSASIIKRQTGIKDFGNIMPGHGGLMDRFDSVLFVAPFMSLVLGHIMIFN
ncbi:MAG: phosphatidate cytidylyltransferase [Ruminococcus sp.]|jgi:phosphatidate cytidylyltransferase|nr:phosphatidate cytidylyltransferase [Ruminococcus sp.]